MATAVIGGSPIDITTPGETYEGSHAKKKIPNACCIISRAHLVQLGKKNQEYAESCDHTLHYQDKKLAKRQTRLIQQKETLLTKHQNNVAKAETILTYLKEESQKDFKTIRETPRDIGNIDLKIYNAHHREVEPTFQTLNSYLDREIKSCDPGERNAAQFLHDVLNLFASYNWFSSDNQRSPVSVVYNFGKQFLNAVNTGTKLVFGNFPTDDPYIGDFLEDVVFYHEFTHGVVDHITPLIYQYQSGALNEHNADVFAFITKLFANNWSIEQAKEQDMLRIGDIVIKDLKHNDKVVRYSLRSLDAPGTALGEGDEIHPLLGPDAQPAMFGEDFQDTEEDEGGVHINSGPLNRAFYLAAAELGGYEWWKLGAAWFLTLFNLKPNSGFDDFKTEVVKSVEALYGDGKEKAAVVDAFTQVGLYDHVFSDPSKFKQVPPL